jgi:DNA-binding response OmpR family regulator
MADVGPGARHVALLVEDEPEMAEELGELLESLGYDHIHASTQEEAKRLAERGRFCFVILDLQIKVNEDSIKPRVEAGQHLLEHIRSLYPRRNSADKYGLQILVMSGHTKEHHYVVKAFQNGADDFITKPLSDNQPPFSDKLRDALRRSQREQHAQCAAAMSNARASAMPMPVSEPRLSLTVTAVLQGERIEVRFGERTAPLSPNPFVILLHLIAGRLRGGEGWVHRDDMGATDEQGWKGISRLKEQLRPALPDGQPFYENDGHGRYRLHPNVEITRVDCDGLKSHSDHRVCKLATEIHSLFGCSS